MSTTDTIIPRNLIEGANNNSFFDRGSGLEREAQSESAAFETCDELKRLEKVYGGFMRLENNHEAARVQLFFDGKPDEDTRTRLKACGFRWSPRFGAWQRQNTPNGLAVARQFFNDYKAA